MHLTNYLTPTQSQSLHHNALRVLSEVGVGVEHEGVRIRLANIGGICDGERVRFPSLVVEKMISEAPKQPMDNSKPTVSMGTGVYQCWYQEPDTRKLLHFDEDRLARYLSLAKSLPGVNYISLLGMPFLPEGIPAELLPLAERLYAWKHGVDPGGSVTSADLCQPLLEMCECHASYTGKRLDEVFIAGGWMISPLRLARCECEELLFFAERGLPFGVGHLPSRGGTAPVTLTGAITLALAETIFLFLLSRAFQENTGFGLGSMASAIDMRTGMLCYGRPEQVQVLLAFADLARFYGCSCWGHTGCSDARVPSVEAGAQKAMGALTTALATGNGYIEVGLLGTDEICSPVQMVLDHDIARSLNALLAEPEINDMECAFEEIAAVGIGGNHFGTDYTFENFKTSLFQPKTWAYQPTSAWLASGMKTDTDHARDYIADFYARFTPTSHISEEEERELRGIIGKIP